MPSLRKKKPCQQKKKNRQQKKPLQKRLKLQRKLKLTRQQKQKNPQKTTSNTADAVAVKFHRCDCSMVFNKHGERLRSFRRVFFVAGEITLAITGRRKSRRIMLIACVFIFPASPCGFAFPVSTFPTAETHSSKSSGRFETQKHRDHRDHRGSVRSKTPLW